MNKGWKKKKEQRERALTKRRIAKSSRQVLNCLTILNNYSETYLKMREKVDMSRPFTYRSDERKPETLAVRRCVPYYEVTSLNLEQIRERELQRIANEFARSDAFKEHIEFREEMANDGFVFTGRIDILTRKSNRRVDRNEI